MRHFGWPNGTDWYNYGTASRSFAPWHRDMAIYGLKQQTRYATPLLEDSTPAHKDALKTKVQVPPEMVESMRNSVQSNIRAKTIPTAPTQHQPQNNQQTHNLLGWIPPPTIDLRIEDNDIASGVNVCLAIELQILSQYKKESAKSRAQSFDDSDRARFWSGLEEALDQDLHDLDLECETRRNTSDSADISLLKHRQSSLTVSIPAVHQPPQSSVHSPSSQTIETPEMSPESPHHPENPEYREIPHFDDQPELTATSTLPPSSRNSSHRPSLPSSDTSESDMDDRTVIDENELYRRVRRLHNEAREISLRLYHLRHRRKNLDISLDEEDQRVLNRYRAQLANHDPKSGGPVFIDHQTAFGIEKILTRKRDAVGPLIDQMQELERELTSVQSREQQLEDQLHRHYANMHLEPIEQGIRSESMGSWDEESEPEELELFDPSDHHPLYNEWQDHEARLKNLQEKLWAFEEEDARLASQKELRERVGKHLAKEDEEERAALPSKIADLRAKFEMGEEESKRLREECLELGIIDDYGRPRQNLAEDEEQSGGEASVSRALADREHTGRVHDVKQEQEWKWEAQSRERSGVGELAGDRTAINRESEDSTPKANAVGQESREISHLSTPSYPRSPRSGDGWELVPADQHHTFPHIGSPATISRDELEQQPDLTLVVSPPSNDERQFGFVSQDQSASGLLVPSTHKPPASHYSEYPMFALSTTREVSAVPSHSDPLSVDAWLFDQLIDSGMERRLLATILQAKGAAEYEELEMTAEKIISHWNDNSYALRNWSPTPTWEALRESVGDIKREGYDKLLVKQVVGYALERSEVSDSETEREQSIDDAELPD